MNNFVVRVKRRRDESAVDSICVVEDAERANRTIKRAKVKGGRGGGPTQNIFDSFNRLSTGTGPLNENDTTESLSNQPSGPTQVIMRRLVTIDAGVNVDSATLSQWRAGGSDKTPPPPQTASEKAPPTLLVSRGKKRIRDEQSDSQIVVVDLASANRRPVAVDGDQGGSKSPGSQSSSSSVSLKSFPSSKGVRVLDPMSRKLQGLLGQVVESPHEKQSDALWRAITTARQEGGDINVQRPKDGLSALMLAAEIKDRRSVKALLDMGALALKESGNGESALSIARRLRFAALDDVNAREVLLLIQNAAASEIEKIPTTGNGDDDYVVDVYVVKGAGADTEMATETGTGTGTGTGVDSTCTQPQNMETVQIAGLVFDQEDYVFSYDSDWSDLANDEDPDSNDERHFGNDYPDEEDEDDIFGADIGGDNEECGVCYHDGTYGNDDGDDFDDDDDEDDDDGGGLSFRHRAIPTTHRQQQQPTAGLRPDPTMSLRQQLASRYRMGHVVHAQDDLDEGDAAEFEPRASSGGVSIPLYGQELSDDEDSTRLVFDTYNISRPPPDTVAYDPELDG